MTEFWKPFVERGIESQPILYNVNKRKTSISQQRQLLPIFRYRTQILYALEKFPTVILIGETGCGKTTQIPQYLFETGWTADRRCIACTQPRRVAAISVASRVADEMGVNVGEEVGYSVRFDSKCGSNTVLKYCTDGWLLRETMSDPLFSKYSVIMIDEAHERSLNSDILMGLLKKVRRKRKDLRIIVTSATMNAMNLRDFFETNTKTNQPGDNTAMILSVEGRLFPVDYLYLENPTSNYIQTSVETVLNIHRYEVMGDILVFLPSSEDIDYAIELLKERFEGSDMFFLPLYSTLPFQMQMQVFEPSQKTLRKVVVSTNIAETSVTIEGIRYVVDSGFVKLNYFDYYGGLDKLICCPISKASAKQRAGRAGRTQYGKCFRLLTENDYNNLTEFTPPEMQRTDISWSVLQLKALGIDDVLHFDFLSPPSAEAMIYALELLYSLGGLDDICKLTPIGEKMAEMPVEPRLAKALLSSYDFGCGEEILTIAAMCSVEYPFITMKSRASIESKQRLADCISEFVSLEGDHLTLLNIWNAYRDNNFSSSWCDSNCISPRILTKATELRGNMLRMLRSFGPEGSMIASAAEDTETIRKCIVKGYFANAAQLKNDGNYYTIRGKLSVQVHHTSIYAKYGTLPEWVVFNEVNYTKTANIREIIKIEPRWLLEQAEHYYTLL